MHAAEKSHDRGADHDVVKVRDHEIGIVQLHVEPERGEKQAGQAADREQADETQRIEHRRLERDMRLVECRRPVEHLDRRRHRDEEGQQREHRAGIGRLPADEHVMAPNQKPERGDRKDRIGHEAIAEHRVAAEAADDLARDAHGRHDHDVDGRMRVEPEQVLEQQRIAAQRRIEHADAESALDTHEHQRHREHRRRQHQDQAGRVHRPDEQRQAEPGHARRAHLWIVTMKLSPVENRRETRDEDAGRDREHVGGAERCVE